MQLDPDNAEFNLAIGLAEQTNISFYLTGKAGTGKTTFLKYIAKNTSKNVVIAAPTGVAAINAGGITLHSLFGIPLRVFTPYDDAFKDTKSFYRTFKINEIKRDVLKNMDLLLIDEISMVRADIIDVIDKALRIVREQSDKPFGNTQVIFIGDLFQLPPVVRDKDKDVLTCYYNSPYFFDAAVFKETKLQQIELQKIYRQSDNNFINLLNKIRVNDINDKDLEILNSRYIPSYENTPHENGAIILTTHKAQAEIINRETLDAIPCDCHEYIASIVGEFPESNYPTDKVLKLKEGAQVMFVKNDHNTPMRYYNGKIGKVSHLTDEYVSVTFDDGIEINITQDKWDNYNYTFDHKSHKIDTEVTGTFLQLPLKLAYAITIHKSQGLTFSKVIIDGGQAFATGQIYVALSRCETFNGIKLISKIPPTAINSDNDIAQFSNSKPTINTLILELINGNTEQQRNINKALTEFKKECTKLIQENAELFSSHQLLTEDHIKQTLLLQEAYNNIETLNEKNRSQEDKIKELLDLNSSLSKANTNNTAYIEQLSAEIVSHKELYTSQQQFIERQNDILNKTQQQVNNIQISYNNLLREVTEAKQEAKLQYDKKRTAIKWCIAITIGLTVLLVLNSIQLL